MPQSAPVHMRRPGTCRTAACQDCRASRTGQAVSCVWTASIACSHSTLLSTTRALLTMIWDQFSVSTAIGAAHCVAVSCAGPLSTQLTLLVLEQSLILVLLPARWWGQWQAQQQQEQSIC